MRESQFLVLCKEREFTAWAIGQICLWIGKGDLANGIWHILFWHKLRIEWFECEEKREDIRRKFPNEWDRSLEPRLL